MREIGVLLFDGFSNHCLANAVEPLRAANTLSRQRLYRWEFLTVDGGAATSSSGLPVMPSMRLGDHSGGDYLFVLPSYGFDDHATPINLRSLRAAGERFETLVGMDTGSWLLAKAGLLDGRGATIHWDELRRFEEAFPEVDVSEDRYVIDGNRLSCGGVTTTFELVLELIRRQHGTMLRLEVAALFMHGERSRLTDPQLRMTGEQTVDAAVALMRRNLENRSNIRDLAGELDVSQRRLETLFADRLGQTPARVYKGIRLREARRMAEQSRLSLAEIAGRCGYENASAMSRAFRQEFGICPSDCRKDGAVRPR